MNDIDHLWHDGDLPVVNGVVFRNGNIVSFAIVGYGSERKISPASTYDLNDFMKNEDAILSSVDVMDELVLHEKTGFSKAICGEGSYGGDGFVATLDADNKICWAAVFDCSNPFVQLLQQGEELVAINNLGECWVFPLSAPSSFYVTEGLVDY